MRGVALLALTLFGAGNTFEARSCDNNNTTTNPDVISSPSQSSVFTTQDGVRFRVEVVVSNLEIPWALAFAPDGRLFVTERPGRVRIIDVAGRSSQLALTIDDVFAEGEA